MEDRRSVNKVRRFLSLYMNPKADVASSVADNRSPAEMGVGLEHGHNSSDVYGIVGYVTVIVATVVLIIWAYVPDYWLHSIGIYYYPIRYWALAVPNYVMVTTVVAIVLYTGLEFLATPPPTSLKSIFDECSEEPMSGIPILSEEPMGGIPMITDYEQATEPISDVGTKLLTC